MKYIYTSLLAICFTFSLSAQQVSVGLNGSDLYYKTEANVYLASLKLTFKNEITSSTTDNITSWQNIYGKTGSELTITPEKIWTITMSDDNKTMLLYTDANGAFKPTNEGEYVKFFALTSENELVSVDDAAAFLSDDATLTKDEAITPSTAVNATLSVGNFEINPELKVYPNPATGDKLLISGLDETLEASVFDVMGREILKTTVSPSKNSINISNLKSNVYLLQLKNEKNSRAHTIVIQ